METSTLVKITGSEAVLRCLVEEGTDLLFGYPGGAIMPVYDALYGYSDKLRHILVRHEQGAVHAAQGYARVSSRVGVVLATSGPGATNLITGLADAMIDSTPLVCITGQVASSLLGTDAFQETDVVGISMPVTKWNCQVTRAKDIPEVLAKAFYIARSGRPGPVLIDITKDAQFEEMEFSYTPCQRIRSYWPVPVPSTESISKAAELINGAKRPLVLLGQGVALSKAEAVFSQVVEKAGLPVASTLLGLSAFPVSHPLYVGYLGMHGNYAPNKLTNEADVLIAVGMRFDDRVTGNLSKYAKQAQIIHIDIDAAEFNKLVKAHVCVHADASQALASLLPLLQERKHGQWLQRFRELEQVEWQKIRKPFMEASSEELHMAEVVLALSDLTKGKAVVVTDVGQHQMVTSRYYAFADPRSCISSGGLGTMGFALPAALGAQLGAADRKVVAVIGDGGFQMTLQELGTIMQFRIPVKIIILNNRFLGMVRQWQEMFFEKRYSFTEMQNPCFGTLADAYGIANAKLSDRSQLSEALEKMWTHEGPYLLEVMVAREDNVFPMVPTGASVSEILLEK